jgi:hypothetical protein
VQPLGVQAKIFTAIPYQVNRQVKCIQPVFENKIIPLSVETYDWDIPSNFLVRVETRVVEIIKHVPDQNTFDNVQRPVSEKIVQMLWV